MYEENPFDAEFGGIPELYLDFNEDAKKYANKIHRSKKHPTYSLFITGVRGSGKTVFMNKIGQELNKYEDTIVITLHNTDDLFRIMYIKLAPMLEKVKKWNTSISIKFPFISVNFAEASEKHDEIYYKTEITKILKLLKQANLRVVFCIDEVSNTPAIQKLAEEFNDWSLNELQVSIIMTGLLKEVSELSSTHNLTFLVRADRFHIKNLQPLSMAQTYMKVLGISSREAEKMAVATQGYAYAFQLIGDLMFENLIERKDFAQAWDYSQLAFKDILFNQAYDVIAHELTEIDFQFLYAMGKDGTISTIIEDMGKSKQYVNGYRTKLIKYGLIKPIIRGKLGYTLPLFKEFIQRKYDELNWG
ncbi:hypothetical protein FP435_00935 [Lactobacillus sp. PV037]|uniref:P-loop NTPase fold protein n=1 Tax=Lactobacillus sp. PV037 TaxID=2594496 RepID=UPI00223EC32D|nr:P-loop NTPase fold protein [Lactobacillus sp. PV037]QNQ83104.1 hypothetical protein FP435_00935 [Lactobacillus sp. PV037]